MKIVFQHRDLLPVTKYGGTERVIFWLMKSLGQMGHNVVLIGHPDCQFAGTNIQLIPISPSTPNYSTEWTKLIPDDTDVINLFYTPSPEILNEIKNIPLLSNFILKNPIFLYNDAQLIKYQ